MDRRQALLVLLAAPGGLVEIETRQNQTSNGHVDTFSNATRLRITLEDKEATGKYGGIYELEVSYKGKSVKFTAKEIWDAVQP